jgi:hypothetical protein
MKKQLYLVRAGDRQFSEYYLTKDPIIHFTPAEKDEFGGTPSFWQVKNYITSFCGEGIIENAPFLRMGYGQYRRIKISSKKPAKGPFVTIEPNSSLIGGGWKIMSKQEPDYAARVFRKLPGRTKNGKTYYAYEV